MSLKIAQLPKRRQKNFPKCFEISPSQELDSEPPHPKKSVFQIDDSSLISFQHETTRRDRLLASIRVSRPKPEILPQSTPYNSRATFDNPRNRYPAFWSAFQDILDENKFNLTEIISKPPPNNNLQIEIEKTDSNFSEDDSDIPARLIQPDEPDRFQPFKTLEEPGGFQFNQISSINSTLNIETGFLYGYSNPETFKTDFYSFRDNYYATLRIPDQYEGFPYSCHAFEKLNKIPPNVNNFTSHRLQTTIDDSFSNSRNQYENGNDRSNKQRNNFNNQRNNFNNQRNNFNNQRNNFNNQRNNFNNQRNNFNNR